MRSRRAGALAVVAVVAMGCSGTPRSASGPPACAETGSRSAAGIIVEGDPWSGYAPFRSDKLLTGKLTYQEQLDQAVRACDLTMDRADIEVTTIGQFLRNRPQGAIVGVIDQSQGADALVLDTRHNPRLTSVDWIPTLVADLAAQGRRPVLAYTGGSPSEELLHELANTYDNFKPGQFELVSVAQSADALQMLRDGAAQAAIVWEPDTTAALKEGNVVAYSSKDVPNSIVDVIVASRAAIEDRPADVQAVVDAYYRFMDTMLADPEALTRFVAEDAKLDPAQARPIIAGIKLYGSKDADAFLNRNVFPLDEPQARQSIKAIGSLLALGDPTLVLDDRMVDGSFVAYTARR
jgi:ABC-type nitrate/sulfonate/bicarbonate transport system substrate-binding protein